MNTITSEHFGPRGDQPANAPSRTGIENLRVWPIALLTALFWAFMYVNHEAELSQTWRFLSRMLAFLLVLILCLTWWLSRRQVRWQDRLLAIGVPMLYGIATLAFVDKSIRLFGLLLITFPLVMTIATAWLAIARSLSPRVQRLGYCALVALPFVYSLLFRFEGLKASQSSEMNWRWTETAEQKFSIHHVALTKQAEGSAPAKPWTLQPGDWPDFRGANRDGVISGAIVVADWKEHPPKQLWKKRVGPGWSGMIVVDGHVVTQEQREAVEAVACYDAATGNEIWAHNDTERFEEDLAGAGPRGTPTFAEGRIYALGANGTLNCLVAETGAVVWSHNIVTDAGVAKAEFPQWGYSVSPLVVDGLVVVFAGGTGGKSLLAYHADSGKLAWAVPGGKQSYSSPQLATLAGVKQIVMHDTDALRGYNIADGAELWNYANGSALSLPMIQPHVLGPANLVVSITPGMARLEIKKEGGQWSATARWTSNLLKPDFSDFVVHKGFVYGLSDRIMCCLDVETGAKVWKKSRLGPGQSLLVADQDALLISNEKGEIILVSVNRDGPTELGRFPVIEGKTWNGAVLVGNRVFLRNAAEMAAYELNVQATPQAPASALPTNSL